MKTRVLVRLVKECVSLSPITYVAKIMHQDDTVEEGRHALPFAVLKASRTWTLCSMIFLTAFQLEHYLDYQAHTRGSVVHKKHRSV